MPEALHLPSPCVVVLVGPGASGKSTWAAEHFPAEMVVSSDRLRALVGVVRTTWPPAPTPSRSSRTWSGAVWPVGSPRSSTPSASTASVGPHGSRSPGSRTWSATREGLADEEFDDVLTPQPVRVVPEAFVTAQPAAERQRDRPTGLRFGLHLGEFSPPDGSASGPRWATSRRAPSACGSGHSSPGSPTATSLTSARSSRRWTCSAAAGPFAGPDWPGTSRSTPRTAGPSHPPPRATRCSRTRCSCSRAVGHRQPVVRGAGARGARGAVLPAAAAGARAGAGRRCGRAPDFAPGGARYADEANVFGSAATVRHKTEVLRAHCRDVGRDPDEVAMTMARVIAAFR